MPVWGNATIGGQDIYGRTVLGTDWDTDTMQGIFEQARDAAYEIIARKGHTDTAIGVVIARIVRAVLEDQQNVLPVSTRPEGAYGIDDVCLSVPCVVGLEGMEKRVDPELSDDEREVLRASAKALRDSREELGFRA